MRKLYIIAASSYVLGIVFALLTQLVPTPAGEHDVYFHSKFFIYVLMAVPYFAAVLIFFLGLKGFTARFKRAYRMLVIGFGLLAFSFLQLPVLSAFGYGKSFWVTSGLVALPFMLTIVLIYMGCRGFALLFGIKNVLTSPLIATMSALGIGVLAFIIPHGATSVPEAQVYGSLYFEIVILGFTLWSMVLLYYMMRRAGGLYVAALGYLLLCLMLGAGANVAITTAMFIKPFENAFVDSGVAMSVDIFSSIFLIGAAIEFNKISLTGSRRGKMQRAKETAGENEGDLIGAVVYIAGLASSVERVYPILDDLRDMTARMEKDAPLTEERQVVLAKVYLNLEAYLETKDPVRTFNKNELRGILEHRLGSRHTEYLNFWGCIKQRS